MSKTFVGIDPGLLYPSLAVKMGSKYKLKTLYNTGSELKGKVPNWKYDLLRLANIQIMLTIALNQVPGMRVVGLERVAFGAKYQVAMMGKVEHVILEALDRQPRLESVTIFTPGTWKKLAVGAGNASKEQVAAFLKERFPMLPEGLRLDQTDALGICLATEIEYANNKT